MSEPHVSETGPADSSRDDTHAALFAQLVMQQANLAMMLLGKTAHPETGQVVRDLEAARLFIDQLEMLEAKTRGNLSKEEAALLKQSLMGLRLAFVEAVEAPPPPSQPKPEAAPEAQKAESGSAPAGGEESHKKFTKKY